MRKVDSDALGVLTKALGLTGPGAPVTEIPDGVLDQVLDVGPIIRRGRTQAATGGIYEALLENRHAVANDQTSTFAPYAGSTAAGIVFPPWPNPMPPQFDIWLLYACLRNIEDAGTFNGACLSVTFPDPFLAWAIDQGGAAPANPAREIVCAAWDTLETNVIQYGTLAGEAGPLTRIGMRLPRGTLTLIKFHSSTNGARRLQCLLVLGVFPVSMGQDVAV